MKKIINVLILSVITVITVSCSNKMKDPRSKEYMTAVVESDEGKAAIEETLKNLDKDALTEKGIIKSYEIDYNSIEHNPMGGIMFKVVINNDKDMIVYYILDRNSENKLKNSDGSFSEELDSRLNNEQI